MTFPAADTTLPSFLVTLLLHCQSVICLENEYDYSEAGGVTNKQFPILITCLAYVCLLWYIVVLSLSWNGFIEIMHKFRGSNKREISKCIYNEGVTILRPLKGIDPQMEACLESSFLQEYPVDNFEIIFCIASPTDPSIPLVNNLCAKYPQINARILVDSPNDNVTNHFGPNPKINNLAKGYSQLKFDIVWVMDSNVKVPSGTLQRSVTSLLDSTDNGSKTRRKVKLVHHLPLAIASSTDTSSSSFGAKCDEMFMLTSHAKFYVSFNKVSIAPCVNGKSNLYRKSDLDFAVSQIGQGFVPSDDGKSGVLGRDAAFYSLSPGNGLKLFARYIGEDNMIGIALWDYCDGRTGMTGDVLVQPLGGINTIRDYFDRRIRWLRVRRYMVLLATLLEPTTESFLSGMYGTFAISVLFLGSAFSKLVFLLHMLIWFAVDYCQYHHLMKLTDKSTFVFIEFVRFWFLRELLALPVWVSAMCGHSIDWRGKPFKIKSDLSAEEL